MKKEQGAPTPGYREALQAIGRYFDQQFYRGVFVAEVDDGYVGKARPGEEDAEMHAEGFTFPHADVQALIVSTAGQTGTVDGPDHCPFGYGVFMAAVGEMCDRTGARLVSILEVTQGFILSFTTASADGKGVERRRHLLDRAGVEELVAQAGV